MGPAEQERLTRARAARDARHWLASTQAFLLEREKRSLGVDDDAVVLEPVPGLALSAALDAAQPLDEMRRELLYTVQNEIQGQ